MNGREGGKRNGQEIFLEKWKRQLNGKTGSENPVNVVYAYIKYLDKVRENGKIRKLKQSQEDK